jgi:nitroreductase
MDKFQLRYANHQKRKAKVLAEIIEERHSDRQFGSIDIELGPILKAINESPSSCDRKAIMTKVINDRDDKAILGGLLVGGVGWIHRAQYIILLFAQREAYKAGDEITFMPFLDAGVIVGQAYLAATANDYAICFVNPNVRENNKKFFEERFGRELFCGAIAIGSKHE